MNLIVSLNHTYRTKHIHVVLKYVIYIYIYIVKICAFI